MKREACDTILVSMAGMELPVAVLEDLDARRSVRSYGLPDHVISITYLLEEENNATRVTVTMSGFEKLPVDARQDRIALCSAAWEKAMANVYSGILG